MAGNKTAEQYFRDAFERLKKNEPIHLPLGANVCVVNVAREALRDTGKVKIDKFPLLVQEILACQVEEEKQRYVPNKKVIRPEPFLHSLERIRARHESHVNAKISHAVNEYKLQIDHLNAVVAAQNVLIGDLLRKIELMSGEQV
ncbi:MAG: hypothetical protein CMN85_18480 [Spongiibacteraceae bacterium]|nr:hypothetical protein [Spongiibacteraceae bacterium]